MTNPVYATSAECTEHEIIVRLIVHLSDGRNLSVPIVWFPRLVQATPLERANFRLLGGGKGFTGRSSMRTSPYSDC